MADLLLGNFDHLEEYYIEELNNYHLIKILLIFIILNKQIIL